MTDTAAPSLDRLKRRQAIQVTVFLLVVAGATFGLFQVVHRELVAYRRGENALTRGDYATAAGQLELAWQGGYQTPQARLDLARALLESGRRSEAISYYEAALAASPMDQSLLDTVVGLYQADRQPEKALEVFRRLPKEKMSGAALTRLGDLQQQRGDYVDAVATYQLAAKRAPRDAEIQLRLGVTLTWLGRRTEAIAALRAALAIDPNLRTAQLYLGRVLVWDGRFAEAVAEFRRALP